jgi:hypothetical protein
VSVYTVQLLDSASAYSDYYKMSIPIPIATTLLFLQLVSPAVKVVDQTRPAKILEVFTSRLFNQFVDEARSSSDLGNQRDFRPAFQAILKAVQDEPKLISLSVLMHCLDFFCSIRHELSIDAVWDLAQKDDDLLREIAFVVRPSLNYILPPLRFLRVPGFSSSSSLTSS